VLLELNGIHIEAADEDVVSLGLGVADGNMEQKEILDWIHKHKIIY
jgi:prophage maintenance system killer protein